MRFIREFVCLFFVFWGCLRPLEAQTGTKTAKLPEDYLLVTPKANEDAVALLKRYGLYDYECNFAQFLKINGLAENYRLKNRALYKLPVFVVAYNGKSIRSTLKIESWQAANRIALYNKNATEQGLREEAFTENKKLWVPWHELNCPQDSPVKKALPKNAKEPSAEVPLTEPTSGKGGRTFPIFGKKYEKTPLLSRKLSGRVFYIVSGHGGPDVGAQGKRAGQVLCEDEYAYDVSLRLLRLLISHGATAYMIVRDTNDGIRDEDFLRCDKDETVWGDQVIPLPQKARLQQRCDLINQLTAKYLKAGISDQTLIEIHVDSRSVDDKTDVYFYFRPDSENSRSLALRFHRTFQQKYARIRGQRGYGGTVSPRLLYMLKQTTTPRAVYLELGNIRNDWDQQRLVLKNNRQAVANWLLEALTTE